MTNSPLYDLKETSTILNDGVMPTFEKLILEHNAEIYSKKMVSPLPENLKSFKKNMKKNPVMETTEQIVKDLVRYDKLQRAHEKKKLKKQKKDEFNKMRAAEKKRRMKDLGKNEDKLMNLKKNFLERKMFVRPLGVMTPMFKKERELEGLMEDEVVKKAIEGMTVDEEQRRIEEEIDRRDAIKKKKMEMRMKRAQLEAMKNDLEFQKQQVREMEKKESVKQRLSDKIDDQFDQFEFDGDEENDEDRPTIYPVDDDPFKIESEDIQW
jgi:hypothetical protein